MATPETRWVRFQLISASATLVAMTTLAVFRLLIEMGWGANTSLRIGLLPLEYGFLVWFLGLLALLLEGRRTSGDVQARIVAYAWLWGALGMAGVMGLGSELAGSDRVGAASFVYWFSAAAISLVFVMAAWAKSASTRALLWETPTDANRILSRPATWVCALTSLAVLGAAPRSLEMPEGGAAFDRWYSRQPRESIPPSWQISPVTLVEVRDYQSAASREAANRYRDILETAEARYGSNFAFRTIDFPLDPECNGTATPASLARHPAACEAAIAVRVAGEHGEDRRRDVSEWLWTHQSELTPVTVMENMSAEFGLALKPRYQELLDAIRLEAGAARALGVTRVPTFFLNGRRLPLVSAPSMAAAIAAEIDEVTARAGSTR